MTALSFFNRLIECVALAQVTANQRRIDGACAGEVDMTDLSLKRRKRRLLAYTPVVALGGSNGQRLRL
jgi:hypothetical protein